MQTPLTSLLQAGLADAIHTLPAEVILTRGKTSIGGGRAALVEGTGSYQVELGGAVYAVTAKCTIPRASCTTRPRGGDRLQSGGQEYIIIGVTGSQWDNAYYLDLSSI